MITREKRKLIGSVHKVEAEFAVFEIIDGNAVETRHQPAGYQPFDFEGRLIEEVSPYRLMMEDAYKDIYIYDEDNVIERDEYDENELLKGKTIFKQADKGNRIEKDYYFDNHKILKLGGHKIYDSEDNMIEIAHYDENEEIIPHHFHKFNPSEKVRTNTISNGMDILSKSFTTTKTSSFRKDR